MAELGGGGGTAREPNRRQVLGVSFSSSPVTDAWRGVVSWLTFLLQICIQIVRGTPTVAFMLLSYVGFGQPLLPASTSFKRLPVAEVPLRETGKKKSSSPAPAEFGDDEVGDQHNEKLTVGVLLDVSVRSQRFILLNWVMNKDHLLVLADETSNLPPNVRTRAIEAGLKWFEIECVSEKEIEGKKKINHVTVFERPGLEEFLTQLAEFANLVLFTAGLEGYARPLVDKIDSEGRFCLRLYRPSTVSTEYREHVKDLLLVSKDMRRTVIVDNNPYSFLLQPLNGIPCMPFSANQPFDHQLLDVLLPLLKKLSYQDDVRPALYERFHMPEWFQMHGIPASAETKL
ncbi:Carboxy-terminal domain RNA polymerase II polypeptide A small phosphatase 1 [Linum perenne]